MNGPDTMTFSYEVEATAVTALPDTAADRAVKEAGSAWRITDITLGEAGICREDRTASGETAIRTWSATARATAERIG